MPRENSSPPSPRRFRVGDRVTVYRRGDWWWAEFHAEARQVRQPLKTTSQKEARRQAIQLEAALLKGTYRSPPCRRRVAEVFAAYLDYLKTEGRADSTLKRYRPELRRWQEFLTAEGVTQIDRVDQVVVESYRAQRTAKVATPTLYHETILIKQVLNFADQRGLIEVNPLKRLKVKRPKPAPQPCYTLPEVERIIAAGGVYEPVFELAAFTGLRIGEIRWLTWADVALDPDGQGGFLHVRAKPGAWRPKDGDDRRLPLHPRVARMLDRRPRHHHFVFTADPSPKYPQGGHQISDRHVLGKLKTVLKKLQIPAGTVHTFRHFFISFCANHGVEPFKLMKWVGHADTAMVLRYYSLGDEESQRAMREIPFETSPTSETPGNADVAPNRQGRPDRRTAPKSRASSNRKVPVTRAVPSAGSARVREGAPPGGPNSPRKRRTPSDHGERNGRKPVQFQHNFRDRKTA